MQIVNKRSGDYEQRDVALVEGLASWAALALRNAQLFRQLMAHMGLYSRGSLAELAKEMNAPPRREQLTVVFADMRGFTQLLQIVPDPEKDRCLLNDYLGILTKSILDHGGAVNKFLGDGLLAIFRGRDCARASLTCAFDMLAKFDVAPARWDDESSQSLKFLNMGIGISTGEVIIGPVGYGEVRDFTVIGVPINLASAYQNAARQGRRVLVDRPTLTATLDIVGEKNDLEDFVLRKPDQDVGIPHKRYHIVSLKSSTAGELGVRHKSGVWWVSLFCVIMLSVYRRSERIPECLMLSPL
jgi:adenylate cyclase